ncbi:MAG: glycosyltransferase family 4 protein [candidate division Zixibacteria bacterium]|nr:glycosyltransferase family 4 protein [candidate division Zixibacteria bacterium]MBU1469568.1 glycosyltransferase family 4 protein [candidate division Zixibacteria bacterium]MBU2624100.1 glycosyltransferase family 4 protein [candidate division Zixibacteria bacterium]
MKIGIKATQIVEGGGQKHLEKLLHNYPSKPGTHLTVFLSERQQNFDFPARRDITYRYFETPGNGLIQRLIWEQTTLRRHIKRENIDVLFEPGNLGLFSRKIPRVMLIHNLAPFSRTFISTEPPLSKLRLHLLRLATKISARRAKGIIHLTKFAQSYVNGALGSNRIPQRVIYMGNDTQEGIALSRREIYEKYEIKGKLIFSSSHIYRYKNIMELVQAFRLLKERSDQELTLAIAGEPYDKSYTAEINAYIRDHKLEGSVRMLGSIDFRILLSFYAACDLFAFPSELESASLILLEALRMGAPIAASDTALCREVLEDAAVFFDPNDPESMCQAMSNLLGDSTLREALRKLALRRSRQFSWKSTAGNTDKFLCDVMSASPSATGALQAVPGPTKIRVNPDRKQHESVGTR